MPIFIPGPRQYRIPAAANSTQQANLTALCGPRRQERLHIQVRAQLALQDEEPQVLVSIKGHQVGYLPGPLSEALHRIVRYGERSPHETFECGALITGLAGQLAIRLDLPFDDD